MLVLYGRLVFRLLMMKTLKDAELLDYFFIDGRQRQLIHSERSVNLFNGGVADKQAGKYSGGMKRRFSVAISLIEEEVQCCHITNLVSLVFFNSCYFIINA